jgi:hypothetical protein
LPADIISELMAVLADEPTIVVCDLGDMAPHTAATSQMFSPVADYLACWPGTLVVLCLPDPTAYTRALPAAIDGRLLVHSSRDAGIAEASALLRPIDHAQAPLAPMLTAARDARQFTVRTLLDWHVPQLISPVSLVVSELVTNSVIHALTVIDLALSHADGTVRIAVHDHAGGRPSASPEGVPGHALGKRGLVLVQAFTRSWGVFPGRAAGKTVWAVVDVAGVGASPGQRLRSVV